MSKLIKHEFRATARLLLPLLLVFAVSALLEAIISKTVHCPDIIQLLVTMVFSVSLIAIFIVGLVVIISRFYKNTMTDNAYLTMTLPITEHEFIWGELIVNMIWVLIVAVVLVITTALSAQVSGVFQNLPFHFHSSLFGFDNWGLVQNQTTVFGSISVAIQLVLGAVLMFLLICLHFYCSMAIGQLFDKHRILMSFLAFLLIRMVGMSLLTTMLGYGGGMSYSFNMMYQGMDGINLVLGLNNLVIAVAAAVLYVPTFLLIGKKLNLS